MLYRDAMGVVALAALLCAASCGAWAFDDATYPDLKGQWIGLRMPSCRGQPSFDPTKCWGTTQDAPLTPEYEAIFKEVGKVYTQSGIQAALREWARQMVELSKRRYEDPAVVGFIYAKAGDKDQAFAWLEKGLKEKSDGIQYLKTNPMADSLRSDPRYADMIKRMGLPQ